MQGLGKVAMYRGDGVNDLAALAAADVGMAVGSSDASAVASVITKQQGIAGGKIPSFPLALPVTDCHSYRVKVCRHESGFATQHAPLFLFWLATATALALA